MNDHSESHPSGERRPIKSREKRWSQAVAHRLATMGVPANAISASSILLAALAGVALVATPYVESAGWAQRLLWLVAAAGMQLRLLANMFDGMVALDTRTASPVGELYNEVPDRISDTLIVVGLGYAATGLPALGWLAALVALLVAYVRAMAKIAGATQSFCGPMAKPQRMAATTGVCLFMTMAPATWRGAWVDWPWAWGAVQLTLMIVIVGGLITAGRRLWLAARELRAKPAKPDVAAPEHLP